MKKTRKFIIACLPKRSAGMALAVVISITQLPPFGGIEGGFCRIEGGFCQSVPTAVTASAAPNPICEGSTLTLTGGATGATRWSWRGPNGFSSSLQSPTIASITTAGAGIYTLTVGNACGSAASVSTASVTVNTAPAAPTANAATNIQQTTFDANWTASAGATTYYLDVSTISNFASFITGYNNNNVGNVTTHTITTTLTCATTYYYRVRAENSCGTSANSNIITVTTPACFTCGTSTVTDIDGNIYNTVLIGTQCWLKENMRTITYPGGAAITKGPAAQGAAGWTTDNAWYSCPPNAGNTAEDCAAAASLGMVYQWSAAMDGSTVEGAQGVCPTGWHIPTDAEWCTAENTIEAGTDPSCSIIGWRGTTTGSKMANHVADQNWTAGVLTGSAGFGDVNGLNLGPSGYRSTNGNYYNRANFPYLWSSTESGSSAWVRSVNYALTEVYRTTLNKEFGFSVRCVKD